MSSVEKKRPREDEGHEEASRARKRPGGASRISRTETQAVQDRQKHRAQEAEFAVQTRGVEEVVRQHYNAVPQRGREWRKTDSRIKGLRSFNNWIKSTVIHKFSPSEPGSEPYPLRVLDIGCGKGGDLQKWQQAPQPVELYVGIDPAEVSIEQAKDRYRQMRSKGSRGGRGGRGGYHDRQARLFDAEFLAEDAFTYSLGDLPLIRNVGFGPGSRWGPSGGFDVVSMMFCMHYAFENEAKAKGMLANVAGSLRKGGRFFGVIPNSDVIREKVIDFHKKREKMKTEETADNHREQDGPDLAAKIGSQELPSEDAEQKRAVVADAARQAASTNGHAGKQQATERPDEGAKESRKRKASAESDNGLEATVKKKKLEESAEAQFEKLAKTQSVKAEVSADASRAEWGNSIYRVRFPGDTPKDGIFRPPYAWKYSYFMEEAVEEVPEYVVPWEAFRAYVMSKSPLARLVC